MTRVACAQINVAFNDPAKNVDRAVQVLQAAQANGTDLVVFPECFLTGYCVSTPEDADAICIELQSSAIEALCEECASLGVHAVVGFARRANGRRYNSAVLIEPNKTVHCYDKTHLPELGLDRFVTRGEALPLFRTEIGAIGVLVCFDLRHPEATRVLALKGAELIVLPTNWPEGAYAAPEFIASARAAENRVFLATCNRIGEENGYRFIGRSAIYSVGGRPLAQAGENEDVVTADIDLTEARSKRSVIRLGEYEITMFESRRPELYGELTDPIQ